MGHFICDTAEKAAEKEMEGTFSETNKPSIKSRLRTLGDTIYMDCLGDETFIRNYFDIFESSEPEQEAGMGIPSARMLDMKDLMKYIPNHRWDYSKEI